MAQAKTKEVVAVTAGFYGGARIRAGQKFTVPASDDAKWFVSAEEAAKAKPTIKSARKQPAYRKAQEKKAAEVAAQAAAADVADMV